MEAQQREDGLEGEERKEAGKRRREEEKQRHYMIP